MQTTTQSQISHLTAFLYPQFHFASYGGSYRLSHSPSNAGHCPPFDAREDYLEYWFFLANTHRTEDSFLSLVKECASFYSTHLQTIFDKIKTDLEAYCSVSENIEHYQTLYTLISESKEAFTKSFSDILSEMNKFPCLPTREQLFSLPLPDAIVALEQSINHSAIEFFLHAKECYEVYLAKIDACLNAIGKNASVMYQGENIHDYLKRLTGLCIRYSST